MVRNALSRPLATAIEDGLLAPGQRVFDYGCGRGDDLRHLASLGIEATGWDPTFRPNQERGPAPLVNLGYVVNVIEDPEERKEVLRSAWELTERVLVVSARLSWEARNLSGKPFRDGILTSTGTFQKLYSPQEFLEWVRATLGASVIAAAPGICYAFRDEGEAQGFLASRVRSRHPRPLIDPQAVYEVAAEALAPLLEFMQTHGRTPRRAELEEESEQRVVSSVGSVARGVRIIRAVTNEEHWASVAKARRNDLLTYVALSRFEGRPRFSDLPLGLAADIRCHLGTYRDACQQADRLLKACGDQTMVYLAARASKVGKQTPTALYVHRDALDELTPLLRIYEGCARALAGQVPGANLIKLGVAEPRVSYLCYPSFEEDAHPALDSAVTANMQTFVVSLREYFRSSNPPILHRKEEFLGLKDPRRDKYERLTKREVRAGLYEEPSQIGTVRGWETVLADRGYLVRGHRLVRCPTQQP